LHKPLIVAALAALALGGATFAPIATAQSGLCSHPNEHCIAVTVEKEPNGGLTLHVDIDKLRVNGPNHVIFWRLNNATGQKYTFPSNGIAFKTAEGKAEFKCGPHANSGVVYKCTDPNKTQGEFKYAVTVTGVPAVPVLDPWIINR
jgi:hypothetical protein